MSKYRPKWRHSILEFFVKEILNEKLSSLGLINMYFFKLCPTQKNIYRQKEETTPNLGTYVMIFFHIFAKKSAKYAFLIQKKAKLKKLIITMIGLLEKPML
jgi:hypothetical protein